jgi:arylsulfatase A-like enzyme
MMFFARCSAHEAKASGCGPHAPHTTRRVIASTMCVLVLGGLWASPAVPAAERRPNVIVIFTDDQGTIDANCYGAEDLATPAIDGLAATGVRFTQFYAAAPVCSPSRAGLLTGRYPVRAGVPGNVSSSQGHAGMPPEQVTMAETFQAAGYATAHIGKWHLGYTPETMPNGQGFDFSFGHMGGCIDNYSHFFYWAGPNRHDLWRNGQEVHQAGRFFGDLMVDEASQFMQEHADQPFFMYFAMNMPHYPYQGDKQWLDYYRELEYPRNLYAAFVSTLDARIGRLVQQVDRLGIAEHTIIAFQSDHGHSCEERAHGGGGSAGPYRGAKFSLFEGGIRVPAIIRWPGRLPAGTVRDQVAHSCDWLPTLAELCQVELVQEDIDGRSLVGVIGSETAPSPHEVLHWTIGNSWAIRAGDWKLLGNPKDTSNRAPLGPDDQLFLVNLNENPGEMQNQAEQQPELVKGLRQQHEQWVESLK